MFYVMNILIARASLGMVLLGFLFIPFITKAADMSPVSSAYSYSFTAIDGKPMPLDNYRGKVLLVVNTASQCGFTGQYEGLEKLYETYKDQGLVVIGVPSNDFGGQEPGTDAEIQKFACDHFHVTFPLTQKVDVVGDNAHPFYQWAAEQKAGNFLTRIPRWNFHKYLVGRNGELLDSFAALTKPNDSGLQKEIEEALASSTP
jgi:glutathione peroxidase